MSASGHFLALAAGRFGSIACLGLLLSIADLFQYDQSFDQLDAQQITKTDVHFCKDIRMKIDDDVNAPLSWPLARHGGSH